MPSVLLFPVYLSIQNGPIGHQWLAPIQPITSANEGNICATGRYGPNKTGLIISLLRDESESQGVSVPLKGQRGIHSCYNWSLNLKLLSFTFVFFTIFRGLGGQELEILELCPSLLSLLELHCPAEKTSMLIFFKASKSSVVGAFLFYSSWSCPRS